MDFDEFTVYYPELYSTLDEDVSYAIDMYPITGEESLRDWDNLIDNLVNKYEQQYPFSDNIGVFRAQQDQENFRDRDRDRDRDWEDRFRRRRRRRRFRDFDIRDIIRILFLRRLFDRNRY